MSDNNRRSTPITNDICLKTYVRDEELAPFDRIARHFRDQYGDMDFSSPWTDDAQALLQKYRKIESAVSIVRMDGTLIATNPRVLKLLGIKHLAYIVGKKTKDILPPEMYDEEDMRRFRYFLLKDGYASRRTLVTLQGMRSEYISYAWTIEWDGLPAYISVTEQIGKSINVWEHDLILKSA